MSKQNKFFAAATTAALVASAIVPVASAAEFKDANQIAPWAAEAVQTLAAKDIIGGNPDGSFNPKGNVTRAEAAKMFKVALDLPVQGTESFTDVKDGQWYQDVIIAVSNAGIVDGMGNGLFVPNGKLTRAEAAKMIVKAYGFEGEADLSKFADADKVAGKWFEAPLSTAVATGIIAGKGNLLAANDSITRQEFAVMLTRAIDTAQEANTEELLAAVEKATTALDTAVKALNTEVKAEEIDAAKAEVKTAKEAVTALEKAVADAKDVITTEASAKATTAIEAAKKAIATTEAAIELTLAVPQVLAVEAINGTTVKVTFNKSVDKTDAEKANVVTIGGVPTLSAGKLSEDGKTLTLTSTDAIKVTDATVVVNAVQTKADEKVSTEKYVGKMTFEDKVAPSIVSVEAKTNGTVAKTATIQLSEPVKAGALVKVDGDYVTVKSFTGTTSDTLELTVLNLEAGKTHTVELINAEDVAGNKVVSTSATFTVLVDAAMPVATVTAGANDKEILVTFNKSMDENTVKGITVKDEALAPVKVIDAAVVANTNSTQFKVTVDESIFTNKDSRTFSVVLPKDMQDKLGNKTTDSVQKVTLTKDAVKPVATGYNVVKDKDGNVQAIEINFSEGLKADSVVTDTTLQAAASSIVDANGVLDTTTFANFKSQAVKAGDKKVVFKSATPVAISGQYAISFKTDLVTDLSEAGNKSVAFNYTIDFGKGQQATEFVLDSKTLPSASNNVITVTFPEAVKGGAVAGSATDVANYTLAGKLLPTGTTITLDKDQKVATITLPAETVAKDDKASVFTVANVKNTAGTKTVKSYAGTVDVKDNVAPVLQSARILDNKTIELTYSEALALTGVDAGDSFKIVQGTDTLVLSAAELKASVASGFENKLVLKIAKGTDTAEVPAKPADATVTSTIATLTNKDKATADATVNYKVVNNTTTGKLEVQNTADSSVVINDLATKTTFDLNGVTVTVAGTAADGDTFSVTTTKAVAAIPGTSATTLDLTKAISIETVNPASKVVTDKSEAKNQHKKEVKVTVSK